MATSFISAPPVLAHYGSGNVMDFAIKDAFTSNWGIFYIIGLLIREHVLLFTMSFVGIISRALGAITSPSELPRSALREGIVFLISHELCQVRQITNRVVRWDF